MLNNIHFTLTKYCVSQLDYRMLGKQMPQIKMTILSKNILYIDYHGLYRTNSITPIIKQYLNNHQPLPRVIIFDMTNMMFPKNSHIFFSNIDKTQHPLVSLLHQVDKIFFVLPEQHNLRSIIEQVFIGSPVADKYALICPHLIPDVMRYYQKSEASVI